MIQANWAGREGHGIIQTIAQNVTGAYARAGRFNFEHQEADDCFRTRGDTEVHLSRQAHINRDKLPATHSNHPIK